MKKYFLLLAIIFLISGKSLNAQKWVEMMNDPNAKVDIRVKIDINK